MAMGGSDSSHPYFGSVPDIRDWSIGRYPMEFDLARLSGITFWCYSDYLASTDSLWRKPCLEISHLYISSNLWADKLFVKPYFLDEISYA
jgi:hypothetical protein